MQSCQIEDGLFDCNDGVGCIETSKVCDGTADCASSLDEDQMFCGPQRKHCAGMFQNLDPKYVTFLAFYAIFWHS